MKRTLFILITLLLGMVLLSGCGCQHEWQEATCLAPRRCTQCQETEGEALGHSWVNAACTAPKTCTACGETEGEMLGHVWTEADCTTPRTCAVCAETEGTALGHSFSPWEASEDIMTRECAVCALEESEALDGNVLIADLARGRWECVSYLEIEEYPAEALFDQIPWLEIKEDQTIVIFDGKTERQGTVRYRELIQKENLKVHLFYAVLEDREWLLAYNYPREGVDRPTAITGNLDTVFGLYRFEQISQE